MKKMFFVGASLLLLGGLALADNGDGQKANTAQGRGYGFTDANGDGLNDRFVDANKDGIDDNWVDANKDGINDLAGTKAGTGYGQKFSPQGTARGVTQKGGKAQAKGRGR